MPFKATFVNCNQPSKREENIYVDRCEETLKYNTSDYICLSKKKLRNKEQLIVEIIYEASGHRTRMAN